MKCIQEILEGIEKGCYFDSHYVTSTLIKEHTDEYLAMAQGINAEDTLTLRHHQQIGKKIAKFEGKLVERQPTQSFSVNVHGNGGSCALWKRI